MSLNYARGTLKSSGNTIILKSGGTFTTTLETAASPSGSSKTITFPDATDTVVMLTQSQTLTNKTLTSPKLNENVAVTTTATQVNYLASATGTTGTTSQKLVFDTSPTLVTPVLGVATAISINKVAITPPATSATLTIADGKTLTVSNSLTLAGTDGSTLTVGTGGTIVYTSNKLSALSATTSAELAGVISDATGSGSLVFANAPTLATPVLTTPDINSGTADSLTSLSVRDTSAAYDVTIAAASSTPLSAGRTLTLDVVNAARSVKLAGNLDLAANFTTANANPITLTTTGATNVTLPLSGVLATTDTAQTISGAKTFTDNVDVDNEKSVRFYEADAGGSNYVGLKAPAALAADYTLTLPTATGGANEVLKTDGSGNLGWAAVASTVTTLRGQLIRRGASADEAFQAKTQYQVVHGDGTDVVSGKINHSGFFDVGAAAGTSTIGIVSASSQNFSGAKTFLDGAAFASGGDVLTRYSNTTSPTHANGNYTSDSGGVEVEAGDVQEFRCFAVGDMAFVSFSIEGASVTSGSPLEIYIALPTGFQPAASGVRVVVPIDMTANANPTDVGRARVVSGANRIVIYRRDGLPFAGSNNNNFRGQIFFKRA